MTAQHTKHAKHTKRKRRRRSPLRILIILILVIAVLVGLTLSTVHKKLGKISTKSLDQSQLVTVNKDSNMTDYTNYAFFGIDSQTGSMSDRGNRSDSIIVVSNNNTPKDVKLISNYRDTYVSINGKYSKINYQTNILHFQQPGFTFFRYKKIQDCKVFYIYLTFFSPETLHSPLILVL